MPLRGPVPIKLCTKENSEVVKVGPMTIYIFEDGTSTDNRIGCMTLELPKAAAGPPMHWHRFHDECFFITKGTVRFITPEGPVDASQGDLIVVPPRAIHTFANPSDTEDAEFFMTSTPGYYMDCRQPLPRKPASLTSAQYIIDFRMLSSNTTEGKKLTPSETEHLMALFGTFPGGVESEP